MRFLAIGLLALMGCSVVVAQHAHTAPANPRPVVLLSGIGSIHHPVSTTNPEAQKYFDQGLALLYAFNHAESIRSFQRAAELDPGLAMAHWGIALALGPNINIDVDPASEKAAFEAEQKALAMNAPPPERALILALSKRYSIEPNADLKKLSLDYKLAMGQVMKDYPDDLDAATLYAESGMDLRPWKLWSKDGTPAEGTLELMAVLESVLKRDPEHIGANHYYIHVVEASPHPEWALPSADRLGLSVRTAGHLVHMPSHIYMRVGDYARASSSNDDAAKVDREYIESNNIQGPYAVGYYSHNLHFLAIASCMRGRYTDSIGAADQLAAHVTSFVSDVPSLESFIPTPILVRARFRKWDEILKSPEPDKKLLLTRVVWSWARSMAYVNLNRTAEAESERNNYYAAIKVLPKRLSWGLNSAESIVTIMTAVLDGEINAAKGNKSAAIESLTKAVQVEDALAYDEPPAWFLPARETLGGMLLRDGDFKQAEQVFRADLERNQRNGRSLFGLAESLRGQNKTTSAMTVQSEFEKSWKDADVKLTVAEL